MKAIAAMAAATNTARIFSPLTPTVAVAGGSGAAAQQCGRPFGGQAAPGPATFGGGGYGGPLGRRYGGGSAQESPWNYQDEDEGDGGAPGPVVSLDRAQIADGGAQRRERDAPEVSPRSAQANRCVVTPGAGAFQPISHLKSFR